MAKKNKIGLKQTISNRLKYSYARVFSSFETPIKAITATIEGLAGIAAVACLVCLTVYMGYDLSAEDATMIMRLLHISQIIFGLNIICQIVFRFREMVASSRIIKWIVDSMILLSLLIWIFPNLDHPWIPWLYKILFSRKFFFIVLGSYSLVDICYTLSRIPNRRTNPSLLMALSFLIFIIIGSFVLMLPRCTYNEISYFNSLFVASSAVCITGLSPVDIPTTFTPFGLVVISVLIQLGSLGIITFTSFFAIFFSGSTSIYNQLLLKDVVYSKSMNSLIPTLLYVLGFTLAIELAGAACVYFTVPDSIGMSIEDKIVFSAFHSMSAFCNAGFSCVAQGMSNPAFMHSNQSIYIVTSVLIFAGAVGFPILVNIREILKHYIIKAFNHLRHRSSGYLPLHIFDLNTKLVLFTTLGILIFSSIAFFVFEYNNTLSGMSFYEKTVQSIFNSLTPRSAGFASVSPASFLDVTFIIVVFQMIIGGASQSMAGGIKVNTFGTVILNLKSVLYGHSATSAFHRTLHPASVRRANAVLVIAMLALFIYIVAELYLEPNLPAKSVVFEVVSALFTVGTSLGITSELNDISKVVLSTAMFFGRVGIISFLCGVIGMRRDLSSYYPTDNIIIN